MALFDNGAKLGTGLAVGVGALILAPAVIPAVAAILKPIVKATIKSGLILIDKTREIAAETMEVIEDLTAEARSELSQEQAQAGAGVAGYEAADSGISLSTE